MAKHRVLLVRRLNVFFHKICHSVIFCVKYDVKALNTNDLP